MRQLTQKEIKRCTKILNWKYKTDHVTYWYVDESGETQYREWEDGHHRQISLTDILFTKLWDKLIETCHQRGYFQSLRLHYLHPLEALGESKPSIFCWLSFGGGSHGEVIDFQRHEIGEEEPTHPCLALYEAIGKLIEVPAPAAEEE